MKPQERTKLILCLAKELDDAVTVYEDFKKQNKGNRPFMGYGAQYERNMYGQDVLIRDGLPQSATFTALERKIITLREQLNDLRKEL